MNIYEVGEEKCINGVWGREVNGRFYTWCEGMDLLYRELDTDNGEYQHFAYCDVNRDAASLKYENLYMHPKNKSTGTVLIKYIPKHIRDLENLKRGDIVWVEVRHIGLEAWWASTRFVSKCRDGYITCDLFRPDGTVNLTLTATHAKVHLAPTFSF